MANVGGRQGLVLPVKIVTELLEEDQEILHVKQPNGHVEPWVLLCNTKIQKHCMLGQGWYQFCKEQQLQAGDVLEFCHFSGQHFVMVVVKPANP
ncbi:DNA-binding barrel domain superfamily [Sesbania bispinosa]|nr:DNA-binding barrel domain superfamily [Sesbania bispinosa]